MSQQLTLNIESETSPEEIQDMILRTNEEEQDTSPSVMPPPDIIAFNEQRSCADIFRMYQKGQIEISTDFQRGEVWRISAQTLFIDSLMKQLPNRLKAVLADNNKTSKWLADQLGKSDMTVSRWCTNRSQPSAHQLIEIANLLDVDVSELLNKTK